ncbi:hypothetical protein [Flavobacterium sp.]|uniref:hypothetical protein n=1 Tax=Flavobacterium sp. TaxID=239 RepID=UPI0026145CB2|nr:hypothetical protein [Flavobacterium sp.]
MERLTNDPIAVMRAAEIEVESFDLKDGEKIVAYFAQFPSIGGFPYKIIVVETPDGTILSRFRQWDTEYNYSQWTSGIYNLDRLRIITDEKKLSETDITGLKQQLVKLEQTALPESLRKEKAIVLDGSEWKFGILLANKNIDYTWRAATEAIELFVPIIELIRKQHKFR